MNVFITGANGFIGRNLIKELLDYNYSIKVLLRDGQITKKLSLIISGESVDLINLDNVNLNSLWNNNDILIHLAGLQAGKGISDLDYFNANCGFAKKIITSCSNKIGLFLYFSSIRVYGDDNKYRLTEDSPYKGVSRYAQSKIMVEKLLEEENKKRNFPFCILQPAFVYGEDDTKGLMTKFIKLSKFGIMPLIDSGRNVLSFIYINDLINIIENIIKNPKQFRTGKYIVSFPEDVTVNNLFDILSNFLDKKLLKVNLSKNTLYLLEKLRLLSKSQIETFTANYLVDPSRIYSKIHFKSKIDIRIGLTKILKIKLEKCLC